MPLEICVFKELREAYPTWDALKSYLTSEAGGNFRIRDCENTPFAMIIYKRNESILSGNNEWLRSVVWNTKTHLPVCVSPKKANEGMPPINTPLYIEEFYDGVMINVFRTLGSDELHIATRSQYGAEGTFYSQKTFKELFGETAQSLTPETPTEAYPSTFISFVLQHPEHRVVAHVFKPKSIPVENGKIKADGNVLYESYRHVQPRTFTDESEIHGHIREESIHRGWRWQGFVFRDNLGNRWRIRSATYTYLRKLRGNESNPLERFFRLRAAGAIKEYLKHYGEDRQVFWEFETTLRKRTADIYNGYVAVHKTHEKKLGDLPQPDKTVVFKLHSHFLADLRHMGRTIKMNDVIDLINSLPLWEQVLLCRPTDTHVSPQVAPLS